jgi:hypothetical protein
MVERDGALDTEFMKYCEINCGKLCKFGIDLPLYYGARLESAMVAGEEASYEDAVAAAAKALSDAAGGVALCTGDATNEELLALKALATGAGMQTTLGLGHLVGAVGSEAFRKTVLEPLVLDHAQMIALVDLDPAYQYPLIARRIMEVRAKGTKVESIGPEKAHVSFLADKVYPCHPSRTVEALRAFVEYAMPHALYLASAGIYSDPALVAQVCNVCAATTSRALFLTDFANARGGLALGLEGLDYGLEGLISKMESGEVTSLVLLESPLFDSYLDEKRFFAACEQLDALVVLQSRMSRSYPKNAVVIPVPLFFERKGSLVNVCARQLSLGGESEGAVAVLADIASKMGAILPDYDSLANDAAQDLYAWEQAVATFMPLELPEQETIEGPCHKYVVNPYLVRGLPYPRSKRVGIDLYAEAKEKERYVVKDDVAEDVVFAYEKDSSRKSIIEKY